MVCTCSVIIWLYFMHIFSIYWNNMVLKYVYAINDYVKNLFTYVCCNCFIIHSGGRLSADAACVVLRALKMATAFAKQATKRVPCLMPHRNRTRTN